MKKHKRKSLKILEEAKGLFAKGEHEKALDMCEDALLKSIRNEEAWRLKAIALGKLGRNDEAVFAAEKRMSIFPESEQAVYDYCLELVRSGMGDELKKFFEKVAGGERGERMLKIFQGLLLLKDGKGEEARKLLEEGAAEPGVFLRIIDEADDAIDELMPKEGGMREFLKGQVGAARKKELEMLRMVYGVEEAGAEEFAKIADEKNLGAMSREEFEGKLFELLSSAHEHHHEHEPTKEDMDALFKELEEEPEKYRAEYAEFLEKRTRPGWRYKEKELFGEFVYLMARKKKHEEAHGKEGEHTHEEGEEHGEGEGHAHEEAESSEKAHAEGHAHEEGAEHAHAKEQKGKEKREAGKEKAEKKEKKKAEKG